MKQYLVTWAVEIEADSAEEAAKFALEVQKRQDQETMESIFRVEDLEGGSSKMVDAFGL